MKIYYKDVKGKCHFVKPRIYEVRTVSWLGQKIKAIIAWRKNDYLIIPAWDITAESRELLDKPEGSYFPELNYFNPYNRKQANNYD